MNEPMLVVDFGTTTSSAVLITAEGAQVVREPGSDRDWWPSAVCVDGDDVLVGSPAEQLKRFDPAAYRAEFKPDLGEREPIPLGKKSFLPQDLVAEMLAAIAAEARQLNGGSIAHAVLTVPASYGAGDPRRDLMIEAGERVGFAEVELLPEPVAAAFAPVRGEPFPPGEIVLVYDFGGGTFDAALVEIAGDGRHRVLGHDAEAACGGRDMDAALRRRLRELGGERLTALLSGDRTTAGHIAAELGELVRRVKHHLSDAATARDYLHVAGLRITMDRAELTALCRPVVAQTLGCCRSLLAAHNVKPVAALLVGGTCRMPLVAESVAAELGLPVRFAKDVSTAVVQGAAKWAPHTDDRATAPIELEAGERPLRWDVAGGSATLVRWLVDPGARYDAGASLASARLADGTLHRLTAGDIPGSLVRTHTDPGGVFASGDWLATTRSGSARAGAHEQRTSGSGAEALPSLVFEHPATVLGVAFVGPASLVTVTRDRATTWCSMSGRVLAQRALKNSWRGIATNVDGQWVATSAASDALVWEVEGDPTPIELRHDRHVANVALDATGRLLAVGTSGNHVAVWDVRARSRVFAEQLTSDAGGRSHEVQVSLAPDSRRLATGHEFAEGMKNVVLVWGLEARDILLRLQLAEAPVAIAFSPDARRFAALTCSTVSYVWDAVTGDELLDFCHAPGQQVSSGTIAFSADGSMVATTAEDAKAWVWDAGEGIPLCAVQHDAPVRDAAFSLDGRWLATASDDRTARVSSVGRRR